MKRYNIGVQFTGGADWPMVWCDDGDWVKVEEVMQVESANDALRRTLRDVTQTLAEELRVEGPMSAEEAAKQAVEVIKEAREAAEQDAAENRFLRRQLEAKDRGVRQEFDRNISNAIDTLSAATEIDMPASIDVAAQAAASTIHRLKGANRRLFLEEQEKLRLLWEELEAIAGNPGLLSELIREDVAVLAKAVSRRIEEILVGED